MTWLAVAATAVALFALWVWWRAGSVANTLDSPGSVMRMLQYLIDRGLNRAQLQFRVRSDPSRQMVFTKYVHNNSIVGVHGTFAERPGLEDAFERFRMELKKRAVPYVVERGRKNERRLVVDFGRDLGLASLLVSLLFENFLGARLHTDCVAYFKYVLTHNAPEWTGIDAPDD